MGRILRKNGNKITKQSIKATIEPIDYQTDK